MMDRKQEQYRPSILIVDDTLANLQLLVKMLSELGYMVRPVQSGRMALMAVKAEHPDLILLDINMPEMNGYEVCEQLKADEKTRDIPVVFLSAMHETMDKVKAFSIGGVDYITKPFELKEVEARIETHLKIREQKRRLQENYDKLKELETLRDNLIHMIVHDMRTPLMGISGYLELLQMIEGGKLFSEEGYRYIKHAKTSAKELIEMVNALLDINRMEAGELKLNIIRCELRAIVREIIDSFESLLRKHKLSLKLPAEPVDVACDQQLITRVIENLLYNAIKFAPENSQISIGVAPKNGTACISVQDNGPGIPPEYREKIFDKFGQVETRERGQKYSTGLGLTFCKMVVEAHGGHIGVDSEVGKGSTFWFVLPRKSISKDEAIV